MSRPPRVDALTGVRIFAAMAVVLSHLSPPSGTPGVVKTFMSAGYNGVTFFYLLSGFVLAWNYRHLANSRLNELRIFAVGRFARIYPLYLSALGLAIALALLEGARPEPSWMLHIAAVQTWSGDLSIAYGLNGPGWSIGLELFLYACFPFLLPSLVRTVDRGRGWWLILGTGALLLAITLTFWLAGLHMLPWDDPASAHRWLYRTPLLRIPDFTIGVTLALLVARRPTHRIAPVAQFFGVVATVGLMCSDRLLFSVVSWDIAYLVPAAALIWGLASGQWTWLARLLATPPIIYAGAISFGVYLWHAPLLDLLAPAGDGLGWVLESAVFVAVTFLVAAGGHAVIEEPVGRWIRTRFSPKDVHKLAHHYPGCGCGLNTPASRCARAK